MLKKYISQRSLWYSETQDLAFEIEESLKNSSLTSEQRFMVRDAIGESLEGYTVFKDVKIRKGEFLYRVGFIITWPLQFMLIPFMCVRWVFTGKFKFESNSAVGNLFNKICRKSGM